jgi:hypothetical protein
VVAVAPTCHTIWISAKGFPVGTVKTNPQTQARHWFAHALFDLILWRGEDISVTLALALPKHGTYLKLANRVNWCLSSIGNSIYWADEDSRIKVENCRSTGNTIA